MRVPVQKGGREEAGVCRETNTSELADAETSRSERGGAIEAGEGKRWENSRPKTEDKKRTSKRLKTRD